MLSDEVITLGGTPPQTGNIARDNGLKKIIKSPPGVNKTDSWGRPEGCDVPVRLCRVTLLAVQ